MTRPLRVDARRNAHDAIVRDMGMRGMSVRAIKARLDKTTQPLTPHQISYRLAVLDASPMAYRNGKSALAAAALRTCDRLLATIRADRRKAATTRREGAKR